MGVGDSGDTAAVVGIGNGGGWNGSNFCLLMMTNQASGFADAQFEGG